MKFSCDYEVHYPLGGASYVFEKDLIKYISKKIKKNNIIISIGAQPNSSPHFGTLCVFSLAFSLAKKMKEYNENMNISVLFEVVDTAPSKTIEINGIKYQYDLKGTEKMENSMKDFLSVLKYLSKKTKIDYQIRNQSEFNSQPEIYKAVSSVIKNKNKIQGMLDPKNERLRVRIACPKCGLVDKEGLTTKIMKKEILAECPSHGQYKAIYKSESSKLEYNTPLRNLIRGMVYGMINSSSSYNYEIIRITGGDYSGFYQEELLYKCASLCKYDVSKLPIILYCPQILDWSGAKLSKSIYVQDGAYSDLPKYMLNYKELHSTFKNKGLDILQEETDNWLDEPYKLFRNYSVYYFIQKFEKEIEKDDRFKRSSERNN